MKKFTLTFENNLLRQQWLHAALHLPEGWEISPARSLAINLEQAHCNVPLARVTIEITPHNLTQSRYDLILQVTSDGQSYAEPDSDRAADRRRLSDFQRVTRLERQ